MVPYRNPNKHCRKKVKTVPSSGELSHSSRRIESEVPTTSQRTSACKERDQRDVSSGDRSESHHKKKERGSSRKADKLDVDCSVRGGSGH